MSEYQYYEFQAIDRPLTEKEMEELRERSTRAEITPTSFTNEYHWGDFRGDPRKMVEKYFDAFVYYANWGTHWAMLRVPKGLIDIELAKAYCTEESLDIATKGGHLIVDFHSEDESGDWEGEFENWMPKLVSVRNDLLRGDLRGLYLGWLAAVQSGELDDEEEEPLRPPGMGKFSGPLRALAEFLRIDDDLLEVAGRGDQSELPAEPSHDDLADWVRRLPEKEKNDSLIDLMENRSLHLGQQLLQRFRRDYAKAHPAKMESREEKPRTAGELRSGAEAYGEERRRREKVKAAKQRAKQLDDLAAKAVKAWKEVEDLTKRTSGYDQAVKMLKDLRDLADREQRRPEFDKQIAEIRAKYKTKQALLRRLSEAGLK